MSNEKQHTPEPWDYVYEHGAWEGYHEPESSGEFQIAFRTDSKANAARIVDCVNACEGQDIETVKLATAHRDACFTWETEMMKAIGEDGVGSVVAAINILKLQRDELLVVLEYAKSRLNNWGKRVGEDPDTAIIDKAINNAKPKTDER